MEHVGPGPFELGGVDPVRTEAEFLAVQPGGTVDPQNLAVGGAFHREPPPVSEDQRDQGVEVFRPRPDHHVLRLHADPPAAREIVRDGFFQGGQSSGRGFFVKDPLVLRQGAPHGLRVDGMGEDRAVFALRGRQTQGKRAPLRHGKAVLLAVVGKKSAPLPGHGVPLVAEQAVSVFHGDDAHPVFGGGGPLGRESRPRGIVSSDDLVAQVLVDRAVGGDGG